MALFIKLRSIPTLVEKAQEKYPNIFFSKEGIGKWIDLNIVSILDIPNISLYIEEEKNILSLDSYVGADKLVDKDSIINNLLISDIPAIDYLIDGKEEIEEEVKNIEDIE